MAGSTAITVGPDDHGRRMTLAEFERAEGICAYELGRGVVAVIDVPKRQHGFQVDAARQQFSDYRAAHPGRIHSLAGGAECKLQIEALDSERHPDLAVYCSPPPEDKDWATWIPDMVIEVVSPSSVERDYDDKPDEYLLFGVREYGILDADQQQMTVLRRSRGRWARQIVRPGERYRVAALPGLEFDCGRVFAAAGA